MALFAPNHGEFQTIIDSFGTTRPATVQGTTIAPSATANTYGSYVQLLSGASVTHDAYGIFILVTGGFSSGAIRDTLLTIGVDPAGGTSYSTLIPDLVIGSAGQFNTSVGFGMHYYFPLFIKAGSSIAGKTATNAASFAGPDVRIILFCAPRFPEACPVGHKVEAFGVNTAASNGTSLTCGTVSEGSWTSLGTASYPHWYWQAGYALGSVGATVAQLRFDVGVGDGTNMAVVAENIYGQSNNNESTSILSTPELCFSHPCKAGDGVYIRGQAGTAPSAGFTAAAYGVV